MILKNHNSSCFVTILVWLLMLNKIDLFQDELEDGDESEIMDCLIDYKMSDTQMNSKCRAAVEHFQMIAMQDFHFNAPFKRACKADIARLCANMKVKYETAHRNILWW